MVNSETSDEITTLAVNRRVASSSLAGGAKSFLIRYLREFDEKSVSIVGKTQCFQRNDDGDHAEHSVQSRML